MLNRLRHSLFLIALICTMLITTACATEFFQDIQDLTPLRDQLIQAYHEDAVNLEIQNGHIVGVSFINSAFKDLPKTEKEGKARKIAQFVKEHYIAIGKVDRIWVAFVIHKDYVIFSYTNGLDTFFFKKSELTTIKSTS